MRDGREEGTEDGGRKEKTVGEGEGISCVGEGDADTRSGRDEFLFS